MPTFQSIPLHPILKQRLLEPPNADGVSITTPQALLSRTPQALSDQLMIHNATNDNNNPATSAAILTQMDTLRSQVAHAMMAKTKTGIRRLQQQQFYDDRNDNNEYYHATRPLILGATVNAMQALQQEQEQKGQILSISTGCRALDALVSLPPDYSNINISAVEGFPRGHVLCFSGPSGSGKTQLSLQLAVQASNLLQQESSSCRVRYCYSSAGQAGSALAQRCAQLIQNQLSSSSSLEKRALKNIEFQPVRTTTRLVTVLASLEEELLLNSNTSPTVYQHPFMLVVDSLSNLEVVQDEHQVARIGRWLKRLARQYSIWVVLVVAGKNGTTNGDFQIACHPTSQNSVVATLLRHPARPDQPSITLLHTPSGMTTRSTPEAQS